MTKCERTTHLHGDRPQPVSSPRTSPDSDRKIVGAEFFELSSDEEVALAREMRPAPLSEVAGPQERSQRLTLEQIVEFVPVVQILDVPVASTPAVPEQVNVQPLPQARAVEHVARVQVPLMAVLSLDVPTTGLHDLTDMNVLELTERRRKKRWRGKCWRCSTNPSIASSTLASAPNAPANATWLGAVSEDGAVRPRTANKRSILTLLVKQIVDAPAPQITVEFMKDVRQIVAAPMPQTGVQTISKVGAQTCVPVFRRKVLR